MYLIRGEVGRGRGRKHHQNDRHLITVTVSTSCYCATATNAASTSITRFAAAIARVRSFQPRSWLGSVSALHLYRVIERAVMCRDLNADDAGCSRVEAVASSAAARREKPSSCPKRRTCAWAHFARMPPTLRQVQQHLFQFYNVS